MLGALVAMAGVGVLTELGKKGSLIPEAVRLNTASGITNSAGAEFVVAFGTAVVLAGALNKVGEVPQMLKAMESLAPKIIEWENFMILR
ncbi:MAG: hypothetical protein JWQ71_1704 [Pedosphaera sp.]|nr:hypothetical protein [Pedosphaera sp.]